MKRIRQMCIATFFASLLAISVQAGEISCGVTDSPLPTTEGQVDVPPSTEGDMSAGIAEAVVTALQTVLSVF